MALNPKELKDIVNAANLDADRAAREVIALSRKTITKFIRSVESAVNDATFSRTSAIRLSEVRALSNSLLPLLNEAGYTELIQTYERELEKLLGASLEQMSKVSGRTASLGTVSQETIRLLATDFIQALDIEINRGIIAPLQREIRHSFLTLRDRKAAAENIREVIRNNGIVRKDGKEFTKTNIEVLIGDTQRQFQEGVKALAAEELGLEIFFYSGPLDARTSDQCTSLLTGGFHGAAGFYYRNEITADLHPALRGNPLLTRGHPNCRHAWYPVSLEYAKSQGFNP